MAGDRRFRTDASSGLTRKAILAVALVGVLAAVGLWASGPVGQNAEAGLTRVRWGNVTIALPSDNSRLVAVPLVDEQGRLVLTVRPVDVSDQAIFIDATDGTVLSDNIDGHNRPAADQALSTLTVGSVPQDQGPWPYSGDGAGIPRESLGPGLSFVPPDRDSGILVQSQENYGAPNELVFWNGRSRMVLTLAGLVDTDRTNLAPEDVDAFERLRLSIQASPDGQ